MKPNNRRAAQGGFSLVEILVSLVIGLFVVGAVLTNYIGSGTAGNQQSQISQMTEDAQIAFMMLARDAQMAGYVEAEGILATGGGGTATFARLKDFRPVFGCNNSFQTATVAFGTATCAAGTGSHALEVNYQATTATAVLTSGGVPTDCLGNEITPEAVGGPPTVNAYFVSNRYYVSSGTGRPELHCASQAATASGGQPIAENVQEMRVWYGEAVDWAAATPATRQPVRYVTASDVTQWPSVVAVRVCLLMRTAEPVLTAEDVQTYRDCAGATQTSPDRRIYRAFFSTMALRNKVGF